MKTIVRMALAVTTLALACAGGAQAQNLKVGHILSDTHPTHLALEAMGNDLSEATDGRLSLDVFGNGILGTHLELINQVSTGAIDMALIPGISPFQGLDPRLGVEEIPFLFEDRQQAYAAVDGAFGDEVKKILETKGVHTLAFWENGFRHFTNNVRPIVKVSDMAGIRFRSDTSRTRLAMFEALGAPAVSMSFAELFTGLQQGVVDGQENPLTIIDSANFAEVQKYLSLSGHLWGAAVLIVNPTIYESIEPADRAILAQMAIRHRDLVREAIAAGDAKLVEDLKARGMEVNEIDKAEFREATKGVEAIYVEANGDELLKLIRNEQ